MPREEIRVASRERERSRTNWTKERYPEMQFNHWDVVLLKKAPPAIREELQETTACHTRARTTVRSNQKESRSSGRILSQTLKERARALCYKRGKKTLSDVMGVLPT